MVTQFSPRRIELQLMHKPEFLESPSMCRFVLAAALMISFTASVRAAAPTVSSTTVAAVSSPVVQCPDRSCIVAHPDVRA
jgi:hypothetical protein